MMPGYVARFRLKSSFDVSTLPSAGAKTIAVALQKIKMFLDDGGNIPSTIDQSAAAYVDSHDLASLLVTDFEIVASPDSPVFVDRRLHADAHHELIARVPRPPGGLPARRLGHAKARDARSARGAIHRGVGARKRALSILRVAVRKATSGVARAGEGCRAGNGHGARARGAGVGPGTGAGAGCGAGAGAGVYPEGGGG